MGMHDFNRKGLWLGVGWLIAASIVWLSLTSAPPAVGGSWDGADKVQHAFAYLVLTGWFALIYRAWAPRLFHAVLFAIMGIGLEFLQGMGGVRHFEVADMIANTTGVMLGLSLAMTRVHGVIQELDSRIG